MKLRSSTEVAQATLAGCHRLRRCAQTAPQDSVILMALRRWIWRPLRNGSSFAKSPLSANRQSEPIDAICGRTLPRGTQPRVQQRARCHGNAGIVGSPGKLESVSYRIYKA